MKTIDILCCLGQCGPKNEKNPKTRMKVNSFQDRENWPSIGQVLAKHWPSIDQLLASIDKAKQ